MIYLKIYNNKGFYRTDETSDDWIELDQISKEDLLKLLELATKKEFEMDKYENELLQNPAHNIIYKNIYGKFTDFLSNKTRFHDSAESMYKTAINKYKIEENETN